MLSGKTHSVRMPCGSLKVTVNRIDGEVVEVRARMGKNGSCARCFVEAIQELVNLCVGYGASVEEIKKVLCGMRCGSPAWHDGVQVLSCPDAIGGLL